MILGLLSFYSAGWGRSCRQVDNPRAGAEGSLKPCAPPSSLPAPAPLWAVLVGDVAIPAMAASGLGRGLQPGLWLPTEVKGKERLGAEPRPACPPHWERHLQAWMRAHPTALGKTRCICRMWFNMVFNFERALKPSSAGSPSQWLPGRLGGGAGTLGGAGLGEGAHALPLAFLPLAFAPFPSFPSFPLLLARFFLLDLSMERTR